MRSNQPDSGRAHREGEGVSRYRRIAFAALALFVALTAVAGLATSREAALAQDGIERHSGTFSFFRFPTDEDRLLVPCRVTALPSVAGTIQFTRNVRTGEVRGSLQGANTEYPSGSGSDGRSFSCGPKLENGTHMVGYWTRSTGTLSATFSGGPGPEGGRNLLMTGTFTATFTLELSQCAMSDGRMRYSIPCPPAEPTTRTGKITIEGFCYCDDERLNKASGGSRWGDGVPFPGVGGIQFPESRLQMFSSWVTYGDLEAGPSPTPSPTPMVAAPRPGPSGPPPTVCTECPDEEWAAQQAASWAYGAYSAGVVFSGTMGVPATEAQVRAAQEQLRQCIVAGLAAERQKEPAQQRSRLAVFFSCRDMLPVKLPVG